MSSKYAYSVSNDFPNSKVNPFRLTKEIEGSAISGMLDYINTSNDDCDIWFESELSPEDWATLSGTVSDHSGERYSYAIEYSKYNMVAGEDLAPLKAVYVSSQNKVKLAKADSNEPLLPCIGFTEYTTSSGDPIAIRTDDILGEFSGLTAGAEYYLSQTTAGEITTQKPTWGIIVSVGIAKNTTEMDIHISRIPNIFGTEYAYGDSVGESSTTSTSWQEKLDINISDVPAGGYKVVWFFEWSYSRAVSPGANFGIHIDWGAITLSESEMTPYQTYGEGAFYASSGFGFTDLSAGNHKIALNYHSGSTLSTVYIRRARMEIWRIT